MIAKREFLINASIDETRLETWIEAGWLAPVEKNAALQFSDIDLARARLILELMNDLSVNDEGVAIVLDLLDQVHGLRLKLRQVVVAISMLPKDAQAEVAAAHRTACTRHNVPEEKFDDSAVRRRTARKR